MARRRKIALGLALALRALRAALPAIVTHVIEGQTSSALGRVVAVGNVDLSLLAGRIALEQPARVALSSVRIEKPALKLVRRAPSAGGESEEPAAATQESTASSRTPRISVDKLEVAGGTLQLIDESVEPTAATSLSKIRLAGSDLQFPARSGQLETELGSIDGTSLQVVGSWQEGDGAATVALQKLQLPSYGAYLSRTAGFEFTRGTLTVNGRIQSTGRKHEVEANLTFARPRLRDVKEGAFEKTFGISAPTTVSLLTGPNGDVTLPLDLTLDELESGDALLIEEWLTNIERSATAWPAPGPRRCDPFWWTTTASTRHRCELRSPARDLPASPSSCSSPGGEACRRARARFPLDGSGIASHNL